MNADQRAEIAQNFVELHINNLLSDWDVMANRNYGKKMIFSHIYYNLIGGMYGEVRDSDDHYEIEIPSWESKTGKAVLYTWDKGEIQE